MPKQDDWTAPTDEDDDSMTIDVLIEGDAVAAALAREEIEAIVDERTSKVNVRLKDIPAEYYPFLAGAHNSQVKALEKDGDVRVQIPHYHTWVNQAPAQAPSREQGVSFAPQPNCHIIVSGERKAAQQARAQLERQAESLRRHLTTDQMAVERGRHQFIVGARGGSLHDFLEETGCTVILPPTGEDTEILTIVGPASKIENAINKVMDLASSMSVASVDVAKQHANAPQGARNHARNITRYLRQRQVLEHLERQHDASIIVPTSWDGSTAWEVYSRDGKNSMRARADILNLISGHPPSRVAHLEVDPYFHPHLQMQRAQQIRDDLGVQLVFPDGVDASPELLLVYEGLAAPSEYEFPRRQPSAAETREFERALREAEDQILNLVNAQGAIVSRNLAAAEK